jgi:hypothetical protein
MWWHGHVKEKGEGMRFSIVVEDKKKGKLVVPLTKREIGALGELGFFFHDEDWKCFKLNKIDEDIGSACRKFGFLLFDVKDEGKSYPFVDGKIDKKNFSIHYLYGKPRWKK